MNTNIITVHPGRSRNYHCSVPNNAEGLAYLENLRKNAKANNLIARGNALRYGQEAITTKVEICGRLGKNNPNAIKYRERNKKCWGNAYLRINKGDAATLDIYCNEYKTVTMTFPDGTKSTWKKRVN